MFNHYGYGRRQRDIPWEIAQVRVDPSFEVIEALRSRQQLTEVDFPEGLQRIHDRTFKECTSLQQIRIPSTVKEIGEWAFSSCTQLRDVELCEGLERIDRGAFNGCTSLQQIRIPSTVKEIGTLAFSGCTQLRDVELCEGLKRINPGAFCGCTSLQRVSIPSTVNDIGSKAFDGCTQLMNVELPEGLLKSIGDQAFASCTSLRQITIPSTVKYIHANSFKGCNSLTTTEFSDQIERIVNNTSLNWWNTEVSGILAEAYFSLAIYYIPLRMDAIKLPRWKNNIRDMLQRIPTMIFLSKEENLSRRSRLVRSICNLDGNGAYFLAIRSRLSIYEYMQALIAPTLELVLWKSKMSEKSRGNHPIDEQMKLQCRYDSLSMVSIIIPNVLSFLVVE